MILILFKIFTFLFSIIILVSLHELGHLIAARLCNVKVIRYSIGFGKPIFSKVFKGIEWCIALIPLGGYVKMLDTREGLVKEDDLKFAFDKQHPLKKIFIVIAGPITNLILAIFIYIFVFSFGVKEFKPVVGSVIPGSFAQIVGFKSSDKILKINNRSINSFEEAVYILIEQLDIKDKVLVNILNEDNNFRTIKINKLDYQKEIEDLFKYHKDIGILPVKYTTIISKVIPGSIASEIGLKEGDQLEFINGEKIKNWFYLDRIIKDNGGRELKIGIIRRKYNFNNIINIVLGFIQKKELIINKVRYNFNITPSIIEINNGSKIQGYVGISPKVDNLYLKKVYVYKKLGFNDIIKKSFKKTWFYSNLTLNLFINLFLGKASLSNIGGPVTIANITSDAIRAGFFVYLEILALLSISLGVLNMLPIPLLDGGNILYSIIEWVNGKPLSKKFQDIGLKIGVIVIFLLMIISFINDFKNIFG